MFGRRRRTDDFAEEIQSHLELEADELKGEGWSEDEARRKARVEFGSVQTAQERFYLTGRVIWLDNLARDIRFALRQLMRNPGFAVVAIVVLALGISSSIAMFAFADAALLQPLPYANPNRLMSVNESSPQSPRWPLSYPEFLDWQAQNKSFVSLDIYSRTGFLLRADSGAVPVQALRVSGGFFQTLGVAPELGRDFNPGEDRIGGPNVAILSHGAWVRRFGSKRDVIGQPVDLDNQAYTVIGVMPRSFSFPPGGDAEFWTPINTLSTHEHSRTFYNFFGVGRVRDGVTPQAAQSEMTGIARQLQAQYGITGRDVSASVGPLSEIIVGDVRPILLMLLGGADLLLLIACINVGSLVLVRSENRRYEIAVRGALGATPARLVKQFVAEGLLLAAFGGGAGLIAAAALIRLLARIIPKDMAARMPFLENAGPNTHTAIFAGVVVSLATLLLTIMPVLRLAFQRVRAGISDGGRNAASRLWRRLGANLVIGELAIAVVLLAGAGLLGRSFYRLLHVPLGFDPGHLATLEVTAPTTIYTTSHQTAELERDIMRRAAALPGVESVGLTMMLPAQCNCPTDGIHIVGRPDHDEHNEVTERHVSAGYFETLKAAFVRGRSFTDDDDSSKPGVAVINQAFARRYFRGQNPVGERIANDEGGHAAEWQIVGVVGDIHEGPLDSNIMPTEYFPISQTNDHRFALVVRTAQNPSSLLPVLAGTLHEIGPSLGASDGASMAEKIDATQTALLHRSSAWLVGGFAVVALVLGIVGLYGVVSYSVSQRTREIGVRMALGAQRSSVYRMILWQAGWLTAAGLGIGLACSVGMSTLIRSLLFGVPAWDVVTLASVTLLLAIAAMAASLLPARRAASVDPVKALRAE